MASQAKVRVACHEHFTVHRAVRVMAHGAAFAQRLVVEDIGPGLLAMTLRAALVMPRHGQTTSRLENISPVRVVALDAIHAAFNHRMMLRQIEFGLGIQMTLKAGSRVFARVDDESSTTASCLDVFASRPVTGLAPGFSCQLGAFKVDARMGAGWKNPGDIGVAIVTGLVTNVSCARNLRRRHHRARNGGTGIDQHQERASYRRQKHPRHGAASIHEPPPLALGSAAVPGQCWNWLLRRHCTRGSLRRAQTISSSTATRRPGRQADRSLGPKMCFPDPDAEPPGRRAYATIAG